MHQDIYISNIKGGRPKLREQEKNQQKFEAFDEIVAPKKADNQTIKQNTHTEILTPVNQSINQTPPAVRKWEIHKQTIKQSTGPDM